MTSQIKLTEYSHGAGCGCKISPSMLDSILQGQVEFTADKYLLVGTESKDDAAVYDLGNGEAIISTTDFFMPIVDDPFTFGQIAATNALSDVYAMGASPMMAIAILGWPIAKLDADIAARVVDGGRQACKDAGIILAGGHSIDAPEPIFGLAATGRIKIDYLKQNNRARAGCVLYLTKPLGVGILCTAQKQKKLKAEHEDIAINSMIKLNKIGERLGRLPSVTAMTDVTGFGLLGHLLEVCQGSNVAAQVDFERIPLLDPAVEEYRRMGCIPGGGSRNFDSYGHHISTLSEQQKHILCDPQT
ncbi:MAG: selenide, water dikinase SelD, partial [Proteobacteria bacterium]|nr:selenide, water dikinase SelD [Pseudomonadota bacterium]